MTYLASLTEEIEDKINGYTIIHTKEELDKVVALNQIVNTVIIRRDFACEYFTPTGLSRYIENVKTINRNLTITLDEKSEVLTQERFVKKIASARNLDEMFMLLSRYPNEFLDAMKNLTGQYGKDTSELLNASSAVSRLQFTIDGQAKQIDDLTYKLAIEQENKANVQAKLDALVNRINYQYNLDVDPKKLFKVDKNNYDKVLYIKELTRVQYVDSLVYYLSEILRVLYSMPTRLCVIEPYYAYGKSALYPTLVPHNKLTERDVISGDILMFGMQPKLMESILKNPNNVSILIVLDRAGYATPHIYGNNVDYIITASDAKDVPVEVPKENIISYDESTLYIPYVKGFDNLDPNEKLTRYSSFPIMKSIISLLEGR